MKTVKNLRLETPRLIIRPYREDDLMECFRLMQDRELFRYLDMDVMPLDEYRGLFDWLIRCYDTPYDGDFKYSFNITLKSTGRHIGWCGLGGLEYDRSRREIFYLIGRDYWGQGYAKEAAAALLDYGFGTMGLPEIVACCKPENAASRRVIEGIGLRFEHMTQGLPEEYDFYNGEPFFSLTREEYLCLHPANAPM